MAMLVITRWYTKHHRPPTPRQAAAGLPVARTSVITSWNGWNLLLVQCVDVHIPLEIWHYIYIYTYIIYIYIYYIHIILPIYFIFVKHTFTHNYSCLMFPCFHMISHFSNSVVLRFVSRHSLSLFSFLEGIARSTWLDEDGFWAMDWSSALSKWPSPAGNLRAK